MPPPSPGSQIWPDQWRNEEEMHAQHFAAQAMKREQHWHEQQLQQQALHRQQQLQQHQHQQMSDSNDTWARRGHGQRRRGWRTGAEMGPPVITISQALSAPSVEIAFDPTKIRVSLAGMAAASSVEAAPGHKKGDAVSNHLSLPPGAAATGAVFDASDCNTDAPASGENAGIYDPRLRITNTFLHSPPSRSPSLERFLEERKAHSAPASGKLEDAQARDDETMLLAGIALTTEEGSKESEAPSLHRSWTMGSAAAERFRAACRRPLKPLPAVSRFTSTSTEAGSGSSSGSRSDARVSAGERSQQCEDVGGKLQAAAANLAEEFGALMAAETATVSAASSSSPAVAAGQKTRVLDGSVVSSRRGSGASTVSTMPSTSLRERYMVGSPPPAPPAPVDGNSVSRASATQANSVGDVASAELNRSPLQPLDGEQQLPSRGSSLHQWGTCKPCAFVFQEGCKNALDCEFCHLCEPGERKRRKKERLAMRREVREEMRRVRTDVPSQTAWGGRIYDGRSAHTQNDIGW